MGAREKWQSSDESREGWEGWRAAGGGENERVEGEERVGESGGARKVVNG